MYGTTLFRTPRVRCILHAHLICNTFFCSYSVCSLIRASICSFTHTHYVVCFFHIIAHIGYTQAHTHTKYRAGVNCFGHRTGGNSGTLAHKKTRANHNSFSECVWVLFEHTRYWKRFQGFRLHEQHQANWKRNWCFFSSVSSGNGSQEASE